MRCELWRKLITKMSETDIAHTDDVSTFENLDTTCSICMAEFLESEDLQIHINQVHRSHIPEDQLQMANIDADVTKHCDFCPITYTDLMDYARHIRDYHIKSLQACQSCYKAFVDTTQLQNHQIKHFMKSDLVSKCSQCSHQFSTLKKLVEHEHDNHNNKIDGISLKDCLPYLSAALKISAMVFLHSLGTEMVYICVGCQYSTTNIDEYVVHAQKEECTVFVCNQCSNSYKSRRTIRNHTCIEVVKHRVVTKRCPNCNKPVERKYYLQHKNDCKVIKCHRCNVGFTTMDELTVHQTEKHPLLVELTVCQFCNKSFVGQTNLRNHINRSHKGKLHLYKYLCVYCQAIFKHPQKLFGHLFGNHRDVKPYTCKICDKQFRQRKLFTIHIKLDHKSIGFVEFDSNYHVFFTEHKSEKPFIPQSIYYDEVIEEPTTVVADNDIDLIAPTDCNISETDGYLTEIGRKKKKPIKVKQKRKVKPKTKVKKEDPQSSDDEPLLLVKRKIQKQRKFKKRDAFICNICNKNCYTVQNYSHHMSLHSKHDDKKCIKCSRVFKSKTKLNRHIEKEHSSSKLTETLKCLLEKRKSGVTGISDISMAERFRRTIKKVEYEPTDDNVTIKQVETGSSVQKFLETFTPEETVKAEYNDAVSVTMVTDSSRKPLIKLTKFKPVPKMYSSRLSMPVKYKDRYPQKASVTVKIVQQPITMYGQEDSVNYDDHDPYDDHDYIEKTESIPEVAEEVQLEEPDDTKPNKNVRKVVIPKVSNQFSDMRIAHLLPEAPYYKIVTIKDVLEKTKEKSENTPKPEPSKPQQVEETIKLPDGTKLVTANPLAHLLGDRSVEKILEPLKTKGYQAKQKNFKNMLTKALLDMNTPPKKKFRKKKVEEIQ